MSRKSIPDPIDLEVGLRIHSRRTQLGMAQGELGAAMGVSFQQVQKYERGANRISASMLHRAAQCLDVQPGALFPDSGAPPLPDSYQLITRYRGLDALIEPYAAISASRKRRIVLDLIKALAEDDEGWPVEASDV